MHAGRGILRELLPSGVWHLHYKNEGGRWASKSTGHRDKSGAITWAESFSMDLTRKDFGIAPAAGQSGQGEAQGR